MSRIQKLKQVLMTFKNMKELDVFSGICYTSDFIWEFLSKCLLPVWNLKKRTRAWLPHLISLRDFNILFRYENNHMQGHFM